MHGFVIMLSYQKGDIIMTTKEYSAYIKGLTEGLNLDETKPENKVIKALCGIIEQLAGEIETR